VVTSELDGGFELSAPSRPGVYVRTPHGHVLPPRGLPALDMNGAARTRRVSDEALAPAASSRAMTIVVPVYNESHRFSHYAESLLAFTRRQPAGSELVFVDDGSTDGTPKLIDDLRRVSSDDAHRVRSLRCPHRGKGSALRTALLTASTPLAGFCDLDLSTSLPDFDHLIDVASADRTLAIASRHIATAHVTRDQGSLRHLLGRAFNAAVQLTLVPGIVDTQCGAKVARTDLWRTLLPYCLEDGFAWDVELIAVAMRLGVAVQEVGVTWSHERGSRIHVVRDGAGMLRALARIRRRMQTQFQPEISAPLVVGAD
jgi:hypothetical protein